MKKNSTANFRQNLPALVFHWINLLSLVLMISSGLQIYNANPVFGGRGGLPFPSLFLLGGWLAGGRHWHFAGMTLFAVNLLVYGIYIFISKRWKSRFVGSSDLNALLKSGNIKRKNYALHRIAYTVIILIPLIALFSGIGMYKPAQFDWIVELFGNWQALRIVHFMVIPSVIIFVMIHSLLAFKVGGLKLIQSMFIRNI
jgi:thiosulfate reductase cytochrome b subunit